MTLSWITGVHGFIGRHLAHRLTTSGGRVAGMGNPGMGPPPSGFERIQIGLVNSENLDQVLFHTGKPDVIYHLAGASSVAASVKEPGADFRKTVIGTAELLEWIRQRSPSSRLVIASSAAVYGNAYPGSIAESAATIPMSPYGLHKLTIEREAALYAREYGLAVVVARLFSVFGPGLKRQLLWDVCRRLYSGQKRLEIGGTGNELRDWLHVSDAAQLLVHISQHAHTSAPIVNGGTGVGIRVRDIAESLCSAWGGGIEVSCTGEVRPGDPQSLIADIRTATDWGWKPLTEHGPGMVETVAWCKSQLGAAT